MDDWQARAIGGITDRHEVKIRENAERIEEHIGYVMQRIRSGHADSVGHYAAGIAADAQEIVRRIAALQALAEATAILGADLGADLKDALPKEAAG